MTRNALCLSRRSTLKTWEKKRIVLKAAVENIVTSDESSDLIIYDELTQFSTGSTLHDSEAWLLQFSQINCLFLGLVESDCSAAGGTMSSSAPVKDGSVVQDISSSMEINATNVTETASVVVSSTVTSACTQSTVSLLEHRHTWAVIKSPQRRFLMFTFLPERHYASTGLCDRNVSVRPSVCHTPCIVSILEGNNG